VRFGAGLRPSSAPEGAAQTDYSDGTSRRRSARALVWGGQNTSNDLDTGGAYDPSADSWTPISTAGAPSPRHFHTLLWTGSRMLVWGGCNGPANCNLELFDGSRYDPALDLWIEMTTQSAPVAATGEAPPDGQTGPRGSPVREISSSVRASSGGSGSGSR
jgi:hypothetical protein